MNVRVATVAVLVDDYERAIGFYRDALGLRLLEDTDMGVGKRWVLVGGESGARLLLARATDDRQRAAVGDQHGGRVGFLAETDNFTAAHERMIGHGAKFLEEPRHESYGIVAVFEDIYGNKWDLIEPARPEKTK